MRYMIAIDGSQNARDAFESAVRLAKQNEDELFLISVAEKFPMEIGPMKAINLKIEDAARGFLACYNEIAKERGFKPRCILGKAGSVGEMICQAVDKKQIDFLFVGRRGMGWGQRLLAGSVSRYLMENANCNVVVVKGSYLPEQHDSLNQVRKMEEAERRRRIELDQVEQERIKRNARMVASQIKEGTRAATLVTTGGAPDAEGVEEWEDETYSRLASGGEAAEDKGKARLDQDAPKQTS